MAVTTHINSYIQEVEDAYKEAAAALGEFYQKVEALKSKYASHVADIAQAVGQSVPEIEALVPGTKNVGSEVQAAAADVEKAADQTNQKDTSSKAKS